MVVSIFSLAISCAIIALIYAWKFLNWIWFKPKKLERFLRQQGFNGNSYKLFYGDSKEISATTKEAKSKPMNFTNDIVARATPIYHKAVEKYGEKCFVWLGPTPAVIILDPEIIREIMSKNYVFHKPPGRPFTRLLARGLVSLEKDKWAKHRKLINPAFHIDKLKHMVPSFYLCCADMLSKWDKIVPSDGSCELDVWPYLQTMTSDVISRTAFGSSYEEGRKIFELQTEQAERIMEAERSIGIPGYRFLPTKVNRRMKETAQEIETTLLGIINKRMKAIEAGEGSSNDLLDLLLESNLKEIKQHGNKFGMSMKEVIEECKIFYFAGQETTASLLVWTMILLSKHEDWQARARDEVLQVFGRKKLPDYQGLNHLKIASMIFHEVLRLYPPAVVFPRTAHEEITVGNVSLPAGIQLILPAILLHHDTKIWGDDAGEFKPERFGEGVSKATRGPSAYFPFGWGPRICIGQNFAMLEVKMAITMILQHYSLELSPSYSHAPQKVVTLQPQNGAHLILAKLRRC